MFGADGSPTRDGGQHWLQQLVKLNRSCLFAHHMRLRRQSKISLEKRKEGQQIKICN
jgi:hypothetical protein